MRGRNLGKGEQARGAAQNLLGNGNLSKFWKIMGKKKKTRFKHRENAST